MTTLYIPQTTAQYRQDQALRAASRAAAAYAARRAGRRFWQIVGADSNRPLDVGEVQL